MIAVAKKVTQRDFKVEEAPRRPGDRQSLLPALIKSVR